MEAPDGSQRQPDANAYAPPVAPLTPASEGDAAAEQVRAACIGRESSIKALGLLSLLCGVIASVVTIGMATSMPDLMAMGGLSILGLATGFGLRALQPWARILFSIFAVLLIIGQLMALANGRAAAPGLVMGHLIFLGFLSVFLVELWSDPAGTIFSAKYRLEIIPATRHVRYRTPVWVWVVFGVVLLVLALAVLTASR